MVFKKSTKITAICAACAFAVIGGGYAVSYALVNSSIKQMEQGLAQYLNAVTESPVDNRFSVALFEAKPGIFSRDFSLVAVQGSNKFVMPVHLSMGYLRSDFVFDTVNAKVNGENILKAYNAERLTRVETTGHLSLLGSKFYLHGEFDWINDLQSVFKNSSYAAEALGFKKEGSAEVDIIIDRHANIVSSGIVSNFTSDDGFAVRHVSFVTDTDTERLTRVRKVGKTQVYLEDLWSYPFFVFDQDNVIRTLAFTSQGSKPNVEGDFHINYDIAVSNLFQAKDVKVKGSMNGLNLEDLSQLKQNLNIMTATSYLLTHDSSIVLEEGSSFRFQGPVKNADGTVELQDFTFYPKATLSFGNQNNQASVDGAITVDVDKDISNVIGGDIFDFQDLFVVKNGRSTTSVIFNYPIFNRRSAHIEVNGEVLE